MVHSASEDKLVVTYARGPGAVEGATFALSLAHESYSIYLYIYIINFYKSKSEFNSKSLNLSLTNRIIHIHTLYL